MEITLAGVTWRTKGDCRKHFSDILWNSVPGRPLPESQHNQLYALLLLHSEADQKIGCGVAYFTVEENDLWEKQTRQKKRGRCFYIHRTDGTSEDFSFVHCLSPARRQCEKDVLAAMRHDVRDQINAFRRREYGKKKYVRCAILLEKGIEINVQKKDCHIDHAPPLTWQVLVDNFLKSEGLTIDKVAVRTRGSETRVGFTTIADDALRGRWQEYHRQHAVLRVALDHANQGQERVKVDFARGDSAA